MEEEKKEENSCPLCEVSEETIERLKRKKESDKPASAESFGKAKKKDE